MMFDQAMVDEAIEASEAFAVKVRGLLGESVDAATLEQLLRAIEEFADSRTDRVHLVPLAYMRISDARNIVESRHS